MTQRAAPFYCPYCGEEDLRPWVPEPGAEGRGGWGCAGCGRAFRLSFLGLLGGGPAVGASRDGEVGPV
ncbi:hypothetical protein [Streptomyces sp. TP-A0874]|uniref:hypothetical protein n=1 Tax=Streptomyces sp. TP-A0874 TaxID=549819 RepID=UPI0009A09236|nr:hypothetical protein [Streptomyces sp. TP-A0874]